MRSPAIPHYAIGSQIPVTLAAKTLEEAQRDLADHQALCPGPYRPKEACNSAHNEAWRTWANRKNGLVTAVEVATSAGPRRAEPAKPQGDKRLQTVDYYVQKMNDRIMEMVGAVPDSVAWRVARASAMNYRLKAQKRAKKDGEPEPILAAIPGLPVELQKQCGPRFDDEKHARDRERKRRAAVSARGAA